jgi:hypothetical protein
MLLYTDQIFRESPLGSLAHFIIEKFDDPTWKASRDEFLSNAYSLSIEPLGPAEVDALFNDMTLLMIPFKSWYRENVKSSYIITVEIRKRLSSRVLILDEEYLKPVKAEWNRNDVFQKRIDTYVTAMEDCLYWFNLQFVLELVRLVRRRINPPTHLLGEVTPEIISECFTTAQDFAYRRGVECLARIADAYESVIGETSVSEGLRGCFAFTPRQLSELASVSMGGDGIRISMDPPEVPPFKQEMT